MPCGTTGEFTSLSPDEHRRVIELYVSAAAGRVPVVAGVGSMTTAGAIDLVQHSERVGADAVMLVPPFYDPLDFAALKVFLAAVAAATSLPIVYYNVPGATGIRLDADQIAELGSIDGVDYLKDTSGDAVTLTDLIVSRSADIKAFNGWDTLTFTGLALGAEASVWGVAGIVPEQAVALWDTLAVKGDLVAAREQWRDLWALSSYLESISYVAGVKAALEILGHPVGPTRAPVQPLSADAARRPRRRPRALRARGGLTCRSSSSSLQLETIEAHAEGEAGRVVINAAGLVQGATMAERLAYCRDHLDGLRRFLLREPRGFPGLCAVLVLPPVEPGSDLGIVVLEQGGFTPMSGSNTICTVTAVLESGIVPMVEPVTRVRIDTAVGTVETEAVVSGGKVRSVTVANVPAFVVGLDVPLEVPTFGTVAVDVVFGGGFFVQAPAAALGLEIDPDRGRELTRAGALLKLAALEQLDVRHPLNPDIDAVGNIMLHSGDRQPGVQDRNAVVLTQGRLRADDPSTWTGALDRSPCGTGTCGRMAALHARGAAGDRREVLPPQRHRDRVHRRAAPARRPSGRTTPSCRPSPAAPG